MKFKVDENLPIDVAQLLREAGHNVYSVHEQRLVGAKDLEVVRRVLKLFSSETLEGKLWIVDEKRVRVRS